MATSVSLSRLAWRNLWRNMRRTLLTLSGISFGVLLAVIMTGLTDATYGDMIDYAAKMGTGHVTIERDEFRGAPTFEHAVRIDEEFIREAQQDKRVVHVVRRILGAALVASSEGNQGATLMAIDPRREGENTLLFLDEFGEGALFNTPDAQTISIGSVLASNLGVGLGKKVVVTVTNRTGEIVSAMFRVSGLISTGAPSIDRGLIILPLETTQRLLSYDPAEVTAAAIYLKDHRDAKSVARDLSAHVSSPAMALDWERSQPELASFIAMKKSSGVIVQALVMLMLAAGIFNTLFVSVMERHHEFGVLRAIGFSPSELFRLISWESFWLACVGLVASVLVTAAPYAYLAEHGIDYSELIEPGMEVSGVAMNPIMSVGIYPVNALIIATVVFFATMTAGIFPAWRASRTEPVEAILS